MRITHITTCAVALNVLGCGQSNEPLLVEDEFTEEQVDALRWAVDEWVSATDTLHGDADVPLVMGFHREHPFDFERDVFPGPEDGIDVAHAVLSTDPGYVELRKRYDGDFLATTNAWLPRSARIIVFVTDRIADAPDPEKTFRLLALHELGHHYGIRRHTPAGLMSIDGGENDEPCIDEQALDAFCSWRDCGPHAGTTCE